MIDFRPAIELHSLDADGFCIVPISFKFLILCSRVFVHRVDNVHGNYPHPIAHKQIRALKKKKKKKKKKNPPRRSR